MTETLHQADQAAAQLKASYPHYDPRVGIVLGSGLGSFVDQLRDSVKIPYQYILGFQVSTVQGHAGKMVMGRLNGVDVVCLQGRAHLYEGHNSSVIKHYVRTLKRMGCTYFIATNAAGSLNPDVGPGELVLITDHINFQGTNPLMGQNQDEIGPRFLPVDKAYDPEIASQLLHIAQKLRFKLHQGVYLATLGPNYETAAEIKAFRLLGADVVGMSTVSEVLVAHHCGMKIGVISTVTNFATGLASGSHDHNEVVKTAVGASERLNQLISEWIGTLV